MRVLRHNYTLPRWCKIQLSQLSLKIRPWTRSRRLRPFVALVAVLLLVSLWTIRLARLDKHQNDGTRGGFDFLDNKDFDFTQFVNVFRGASNGGNVFPGVVAGPQAFVKLGPDLDQVPPKDALSGWLPDGNITGFSLMHESGTGGAPKYGVVSQIPLIGSIVNPFSNLSVARAANDTASVGYYKSVLASDVAVELAATEHAGLYQYTFPEGVDKHVLVDVSHRLLSYRGRGWSQNYEGGRLEISDTGRYQGYGIYSGGYNLATNWTVYFCGHFDVSPVSSAMFTGNEVEYSQMKSLSSPEVSDRIAALLTFSEKVVKSQVGISFISANRACEHVDREIPKHTTIKMLTKQAVNRWNSGILSKIRVRTTGRVSNLQQLYSNLYAMYLIPSNRSGENPLWTSNEPYYDDIFTYWDLFRCSMALVQIISPVAHQEQMRSLVDIFQHSGWLPDARSSHFNGKVQGGSNADNVLADAFVKGVVGVDWNGAYAGMVKNANVAPSNNNDPVAVDASTKEGRGALPDWLRYGYITPNFTRAVTRAVEYGANDFSLYQLAKALGKTKDAEKYLKRSRYWRNHWNPAASSRGFKGFLVPRFANGTFAKQDPVDCGRCYWNAAYYEALPWEYTLAAGHHDMAHVIALSGGPKTFVKKIEEMYVPGISRRHSNSNGTILDPSNEPSFNTPYLFNFAGRQDLSVKYSRDTARRYYDASIGGIPGNSDSGAMQAWQLWNMIGLYPMSAQTTFLIGSPWFEEMMVELRNGRTLRISSTGGNVDTDIYYVQSLKVNGKTWNKNWLEWSDVFENGGSMEFVLGRNPFNWARGPPPPSPASEGNP